MARIEVHPVPEDETVYPGLHEYTGVSGAVRNNKGEYSPWHLAAAHETDLTLGIVEQSVPVLT